MDAQIVPKRSQKEAKRDKKSKQRLEDDLGPPGGRFPGYGLVARDRFGAQNRPKIEKRTTEKSMIFCSASRSENGAKMVPKTIRNGAQDGPKLPMGGPW